MAVVRFSPTVETNPVKLSQTNQRFTEEGTGEHLDNLGQTLPAYYLVVPVMNLWH